MSASDSSIQWVQHVPASPEIINLSSTVVAEEVDLPPVVEDAPAPVAGEVPVADDDDDRASVDSVVSPYDPHGLVEPPMIPVSPARYPSHVVPYIDGLPAWFLAPKDTSGYDRVPNISRESVASVEHHAPGWENRPESPTDVASPVSEPYVPIEPVVSEGPVAPVPAEVPVAPLVPAPAAEDEPMEDGFMSEEEGSNDVNDDDSSDDDSGESGDPEESEDSDPSEDPEEGSVSSSQLRRAGMRRYATDSDDPPPVAADSVVVTSPVPATSVTPPAAPTTDMLVDSLTVTLTTSPVSVPPVPSIIASTVASGAPVVSAELVYSIVVTTTPDMTRPYHFVVRDLPVFMSPAPVAPFIRTPDVAGPSQPRGDPRVPIASMMALERSFLALSSSVEDIAVFTGHQISTIWRQLVELSTELSHFADELLCLDDMRGMSFEEALDHSHRIYERISQIDEAIRRCAPPAAHRPPPRS